MIKTKYNKKIFFISPYKKKSAKLCKIADYIKGIKTNDLQKNQFPEKLKDSKGKFKKPDSWR